MEEKLKAKYQEDLECVDDVEELILDGLLTMDKISPNDKRFLERFDHLEFLSMNFLGLTSIENMPAIKTLIKVRGVAHSAARTQ